MSRSSVRKLAPFLVLLFMILPSLWSIYQSTTTSKDQALAITKRNHDNAFVSPSIRKSPSSNVKNMAQSSITKANHFHRPTIKTGDSQQTFDKRNDSTVPVPNRRNATAANVPTVDLVAISSSLETKVESNSTKETKPSPLAAQAVSMRQSTIFNSNNASSSSLGVSAREAMQPEKISTNTTNEDGNLSGNESSQAEQTPKPRHPSETQKEANILSENNSFSIVDNVGNQTRNDIVTSAATTAAPNIGSIVEMNLANSTNETKSSLKRPTVSNIYNDSSYSLGVSIRLLTNSGKRLSNTTSNPALTVASNQVLNASSAKDGIRERRQPSTSKNVTSILPQNDTQHATTHQNITGNKVVTTSTTSIVGGIRLAPAGTVGTIPSNIRDNNTSMILQQMQISRQRLEQRVPSWMMGYFDWHMEQLSKINASNWNSGQFRYYISRCSYLDSNCGGISDRLKPLALLLRIAHASQRIFLVRWERPYPIQEFLEPTEHFNWTVPEYIEDILNSKKRLSKVFKKNTTLYKFGRELRKQTIDATLKVAKMDYPIIFEDRKQITDGGAGFYANKFYNSTEEAIYHNDTYSTVFHGLFRAMFQPSQGVAAIVAQQLQQFGFSPGEYSVAHLRAFYAKKMEDVPLKKQKNLAINAVNCASKLHSGYPVYFASDSAHASESVKAYASVNNYKIFTNSMQNKSRPDPLHLDFASRGNKTWPISAYYDGFVDLLVLGNARCVSMGMGGYGVFANLLSFDSNCTNRHMGRTVPKVYTCKAWADDPNIIAAISDKKNSTPFVSRLAAKQKRKKKRENKKTALKDRVSSNTT